jgi:putative ABC transport system permease protein
MFKNYLKIAFRNIREHKVYSFINIFGLAVGLACLILILLFMQYELSFDTYHEKADQIYRLVKEEKSETSKRMYKSLLTPKALVPTLKEECPEIIAATRLIKTSTVITYGEKNFLEKRIYFAEPDLLKIFSFDLVKGDPATALKDPRSIVLTQQMSKKYFGSRDPMGKTLAVDGTYQLKVTGVLKNIPKNSHFIMDFVIPLDAYLLTQELKISEWRTNIFRSYILLREDADPRQLEGKFPAIIKKVLKRDLNYEGPVPVRLFTQSLSKIHLYSHYGGELTANSDIRYIYLFTIIAVLILMMSCINYVNLATARAARRSKEVGIRKVVGAKRVHLIKQFLGESFLLTFIAFVIAIFIVEITLPGFNSLIEKDLSFNIINNFQFALGLFVLMVIVGVLAGGYPALAISSFNPITIVGGQHSSGPKGAALRNLLVLAQFTISIILIICTLVVNNQLGFIRHRDMGYSKDNILVMPIRDKEVGNKLDVVKTELLQNPDILSVSASNTLPNDVDWGFPADWPGKAENIEIIFYAGFVDYDFIDLYQLKLVEGRNFSRDFPSDEKGAYILNESAVKTLGWEAPLGREFGSKTRRGKIVGIIKDFHLLSLHEKIQPLFYYLEPATRFKRFISVKISGNRIPGTIAFLEKKMKTFSPRYPFEYRFFDEIFDRAYIIEQKLAGTFTICALVTILIACLGLLGLASFTAEQKTKEIGIRKVMGATVSGIVLLLSKKFTRWVLAANIIAWPIAYVAMKQWLQNFAYRATLGIEIFVLSGLLALMIALGTISYQSFRAASTNPVESLRYE